MPFNAIKIDKSLLIYVDGGQKRDQAILRAIFAMAQALDMTAVMEGVETQKQADLLNHMGCPQVQGWLFARAESAARVSHRIPFSKGGFKDKVVYR